MNRTCGNKLGNPIQKFNFIFKEGFFLSILINTDREKNSSVVLVFSLWMIEIEKVKCVSYDLGQFENYYYGGVAEF